MNRRVVMLGTCVFLLTGFLARAEVKVAIERNDNAVAEAEFKFKNIPGPVRGDAASKAKFTVVDGKSDPNGSNLRKLNDGMLPEQQDDPGESFFFNVGTDGGRLQLDLGGIIDIKQVNSYSWHAAGRAPQVYTLYAADGAAEGFNPAPKRGTDPASCGWTKVASVDTRPKTGKPGGQYGVSVSDSAGPLGKYRYLLFDIFRTDDKGPFGNTFYSEIDVRAVAPAEPELAAGPLKREVVRDFKYTLEVQSPSPEIKEWAETKLRPEIDKWYPIFVQSLASDGFTAPKKFTITIKQYGGVAATGGTDVFVSTKWIESQLKNPEWNEATGSVIHELVHVVQQYKARNNPGWLVEGVADYMRWFHFEPPARRPKLKDPTAAKYTDSYRTTAGFLEYVVKNHDHELVVKLNGAMREGRYHRDLWKDYTGMTVQELWNEYVQSLTPAKAAPARPGR
jgi:hypothetical protein